MNLQNNTVVLANIILEGNSVCGVDGHGKRWWSVVNLVPVDSQQWLKNYGAAAVSL